MHSATIFATLLATLALGSPVQKRQDCVQACADQGGDACLPENCSEPWGAIAGEMGNIGGLSGRGDGNPQRRDVDVKCLINCAEGDGLSGHNDDCVKQCGGP